LRLRFSSCVICFDFGVAFASFVIVAILTQINANPSIQKNGRRQNFPQKMRISSETNGKNPNFLLLRLSALQKCGI
jgi:hypothetical protein